MRTFSNANVTVNIFDLEAFGWEQNLISITRSGPSIQSVTVGPYTIPFYSNNIRVDWSDRVRAGSGSVVIDTLSPIPWNTINGRKPKTTLVLPPPIIPIPEGGVTNFYLGIYAYSHLDAALTKLSLKKFGTAVAYGGYNGEIKDNPASLNVGDVLYADTDMYDFAYETYPDELVRNQNVQRLYWNDLHIVCKAIPCWKKYVQLNWRSMYGFKKSWFFLIDSIDRTGEDSESLIGDKDPTLYKVLRESGVDIHLISPNACIDTVSYLSDIVMSEEVFVRYKWKGLFTEDNVSVQSSTTSIPTNTKERTDVRIKLKYRRYV